ncbi:MAG: L,D-transpeptidase family protein, partial [Candidatus Brocadiia bacterium]|nr:L,D-transpeptidase family protein [Candidatus Brocadiia bacterium]
GVDMKKVLVLIALATGVGVAIARMRQQAAPEPDAAPPSSGTPEARGLTPEERPHHVETPEGASRPNTGTQQAVLPSDAVINPAHVPLVARAPAPEQAPPAAQGLEAPPNEPTLKNPPRPSPPQATEVEPPLATIEVMERAAELTQASKRLEARKLLSAHYVASDGRVRQVVRQILDGINKELVFNPACIEGAAVHVVKHGEMLSSIAAKYRVNWRGIQRLNRIVDVRKIRPKQKLKILTGHRQVLVDKSEFLLALFIDGHFIKQYPIGHGKDNKTPTGDFIIETAEINPPWTRPDGKVIKHGEKGHLIGDRWLGFKDKPGATGLGIHGTTESKSIGTLCSNGCIRMHNKDVIELFDLLTRGTRVRIVD